MNKNATDWICPYCNIIIKSRRKLFEHYKECKEREKLPKDSKGRIISEGSRKSAQIFKQKVERGEAKYIGHKHSEESKKKISAGRRRALKEGRGNHWICPAIKRSYPEEYFYECFKNENIEFESNKWLHHYCVDFLFKNKYYFEVDGEQHYTTEGIEHDIERDQFLKEHGYICIGRCRWSDFVKFSKDDKKKYIKRTGIPTGRGSRLKPDIVWVQIPPGLLQKEKTYNECLCKS